MCLIAFAWKASERFPLLLASNRDEYLNRPSQALSEWQTPAGQTIWSGRDARAGGAWIGFTPEGRFAMLTNVRPRIGDITSDVQPSRGQIVIDWLESRNAFEDWHKPRDWQVFAGFNLIAGDWRSGQCHYLSNRHHVDAFSNTNPSEIKVEIAETAPKIIVTEMQPGQVYGLSNAGLDTPWAKTLALKAAVQKALKGVNDDALPSLQSHIWPALGASIPDPRLAGQTDREQALSCAYVRYPALEPSYGTVSSLFACVDTQNPSQARLELIERRHPLHSSEQTVLSKPWPSA